MMMQNDNQIRQLPAYTHVHDITTNNSSDTRYI